MKGNLYLYQHTVSSNEDQCMVTTDRKIIESLIHMPIQNIRITQFNSVLQSANI